jgi:Tol biopolymer transport system component
MRVVGLFVLAACGRIGFLPLDDAGSFGPFSTPTVVTELSDAAGEEDPTLAADMLEIYFDSTRSGVDFIHVARRTTIGGTWSVPQQVSELSGADHDPGISADGLTLFMSSNRAGSLGQDDLWVSTRANRTTTWSAPAHELQLASSARDAVAQLTRDGLTVFFTSTRGGAGLDLWVATRPTISALWSPPVSLDELNTLVDDVDPHFCESEDALYFASNRPGGFGDRDIYRARRTGTWSFAPAEHVDELSTASFDADPWLSPDGHTVFMVNAASGNLEIVTAVR